MSNEASFRRQIKNVVDSANKMCGWILRAFTTREPSLMLTLWRSMILPRLDYCSQLWCPVQTGNIQALEMVQRSFVRKISGFQHLYCWDQLQKLKLCSLERRKERYMIIYTWRILEKQVPNICPLEQGGIQSKHNACRGRICQVPHVKTNAPPVIQKQHMPSMSIHGPCLFNALRARVRDIPNCSTDIFKRSLDRYIATIS